MSMQLHDSKLKPNIDTDQVRVTESRSLIKRRKIFILSRSTLLPKIGGVSVVPAEKRWSCKESQILPPSLQDLLQRAQLRTKSRPQLTSSPGCEDHEEEQSNKANKSLVRYSRLKVERERGKLEPVELSSSPIDEKKGNDCNFKPSLIIYTCRDDNSTKTGKLGESNLSCQALTQFGSLFSSNALGSLHNVWLYCTPRV